MIGIVSARRPRLQHHNRFASRNSARVLLGVMTPGKMAMLALLLFMTNLEAQEWVPVHVVGMGYVQEARDVRIAGVVRLKCLLNSDGSVADVKVLSGHRIFIDAVLENARQWRFATSGKRSHTGAEALLIYEFKLTSPICGRPYKENFVFDQPDRVVVSSEFPCWKPDINMRSQP